MLKKKLFAAAVCAACLFAPVVQAGSTAATHSILPREQVAQFSDRVQKLLAKNGARVAIVSRMGRDPRDMPAGITYTHVAFWVFSEITMGDGSKGTGYRAYNLYQDAQRSSRSFLKQDSPADFFAGAKRLDAGVIVPDKRLQDKLLRVIASPAYKALHNRRYSVLSNPNTGQFQNCTEHLLDVVIASLYGTSDIAQIKANIAAHFTPSLIEVSDQKRAWAPVLSQGLTTKDHGAEIRTATFGSIAQFMKVHKLAHKVMRITPKRVGRF